MTFTDKYNSVRVEEQGAASAPTAANSRSKEVKKVSSKYRSFHLTSVTNVRRRAGKGVLVRFVADSEVNPVTGKVVVDDVQKYEFWHRGKLAVLTLSGPKGADNVDPWRAVTDSLRWRG
ncbi:hypothetical protein [Actinopolymorpha rutila]|uniref:hypothetical protein n=1 Tax=Actinopolymorpha rutila TaxID=446787 RepID=UPI00192DCF24|nr:hypothetical protein [Actinopolymorpha rutila]